MLAPPAAGLFRTDARARAAYAEGAGIFRIVPAGVAVPRGMDELLALIRWAEAHGIGLVPRGAGSSIGGGAVGDGVVVDLRDRMPRVLELDPGRRAAVTSANITHQELNAAAQSNGLRLPPDPSSSAWATLGGMVGCNAAGARSVRYGSVRQWVDGLEVATADGEAGWIWRQASGKPSTPLLATERFAAVAPDIEAESDLIRRHFPAVGKNSSGYALDRWLQSGDVVDLLVGAEGTLAIVTRIAWRLDPIPAARGSMLVALGSLDDLEPAVRLLVSVGPSAVELLDRTFLDLLEPGSSGDLPPIPGGAEAVLLVEFEGESSGTLRGRIGDAVRALTPVAMDISTALTPEEERRLWALRHAASPILAGLPTDRRSLQVIEDGCVPLPSLGAYLRLIRTAARNEGITAVIFGHAGDGNVHVNLLPELARPDWLDRIRRIYQVVQEGALTLGGSLSGEHGDGRLRADWLTRQFGPETVALFQRVKTAFDPHGILNPGVKLPAGGSPFDRIKVGPAAAPIPDDVATALRQIERSGGYAASRLAIADQKPGEP